MTITRFDVIQPRNTSETLRSLGKYGPEAAIVAGGTDLLREIRGGVKSPRLLISLDRVRSLRGVQEDGEGRLVVGPTTTMAYLAASDSVKGRVRSLAEGAAWMGSPQVRNLATFGGNLCNARPCADTAPPSVVCDAELGLRSEGGSRTVRMDDFILGPGETHRSPQEILEFIRFPVMPAHTGSAFVNVTNRKAMEITITSAAARITLESRDGPLAEAKICLGSVAPTPIRATTAEAALRGREPTGDILAAAARAAVADSRPIDDFRGTAGYRRQVVEVLVRRALQTALLRAQGGDR